jgi:6-phospho-beta-glucosidase
MSGRIRVTVLGGSALGTPILVQVMGRMGAQAAYDLVFHGRDEERLGLVKQVSDAILQASPGLDVRTFTTTSLEQALQGADFCLNQVRAGGLEGRAVDETFPRPFGIPGEETVGPGGFNNSRRGIPLVLELCQAIEQYAPQALVLNLTNPSSVIQYAIRRFSKVNVVGTCDSPVALMDMLAKLFNRRASELDFDLGGMHHFGWVTGIHYQGQDLMPEALRRIHELPRLGVDPELVRSLGVIPSLYHKYYFHPDRILAETEGRAIRAHQLMQLSESMLQDFRAWKPGDPLTMLARRGAAWYEKIVVPALLAFAEKKTLEMVLSVDNGITFPWLPPEAIVELPVSIVNGEIQGARPPAFPPFVQALIAQNCAYEMQAAEAIAEGDRDKALRALMSNLLVKSYNQARGILQTIWPGEEQPQFTLFTPADRQPAVDALPFKVPTLYYGGDLLEKYNPPEKEYVLITMEELWPLVKERFTRLPEHVLFMRDLDWYSLEAMERSLPQVDLVVGLGGGMAQDAAKYVAWKRRLPVDEIVSITSVDASVTKSIAARAGGHVTYIGYIVPREVYIDYRLVGSAPARLNRSGVGDILCAHAALWDWEFSHHQTGELIDRAAVAAMHIWLERIVQGADDIRAVTPAGIRLTMQAFEDISIICRRFGSSRPQEASDHTFAYNAEFQTGKHFLHGELVALGTWVMANLQDNDPGWLVNAYERTGILWQPRDIHLTREEFVRTLATLNWYQGNFGRRYSVLNQRTVEQGFIERMVSKLQFER